MLKKSPVRVKICGITRLADAEAAVTCGADALGFIFAKSPRRITPRDARKISRALGPLVTRVGVFVNEPVRQILAIVREAMLDVVQLHGTESPEDAAKLLSAGVRGVIKVHHVGEDFSPKRLARYEVHAHVLETASRLAGGSGKTWDWSRLARTRFSTPMIVTGGLNPSNVQNAVRILRPYAVDVSSGVEKQPGIKDPKLMEKFIRHAKSA
jgi:phosphoribosylanthranilate isomerase